MTASAGVTIPCAECGQAFGVPPSWAKRTTRRMCPACVKAKQTTRFGRKYPTSITPKAADRLAPVDDDKGGTVLCARCRQPRPRGAFCQRCEYKAFEGVAS